MGVRCSVFIAASLDGSIAREDGSLDWLDMAAPESSPGEATEDYGYDAYFESVDALVMGRKTFDTVHSFLHWPYGTKRVVVLSRKGVVIPDGLRGHVEVDSGSPRGIVARLEAGGCAHVYVDGGLTIQSFLADGLIGEMTISRIPIILGSGIPLFGPSAHHVGLEHLHTKVLGNGIVQSKYAVAAAGLGSRRAAE